MHFMDDEVMIFDDFRVEPKSAFAPSFSTSPMVPVWNQPPSAWDLRSLTGRSSNHLSTSWAKFAFDLASLKFDHLTSSGIASMSQFNPFSHSFPCINLIFVLRP